MSRTARSHVTRGKKSEESPGVHRHNRRTLGAFLPFFRCRLPSWTPQELSRNLGDDD